MKLTTRTWDGKKFVIADITNVTHLSTGKISKSGKEIFQGDVVKLNNKSEYTKEDYGCPIFEVTWNGFEFGLKYLGGGDPSDNSMFYFRYYSSNFEIMGNVYESTIIIPKNNS